jgi:hypothetical protein
LVEKLRTAVVDADLDVSQFGLIDHRVYADQNGNTALDLTMHNVDDCAELRQSTQRVVKQVSEVTNSQIDCGE